MADGANVDGRLPGNNFRREGSQAGEVEVFRVCLRGQRGPLDGLVGDGRVGLLKGRLQGLVVGGVMLAIEGLARLGLGVDVVVFGVAVGRHGDAREYGGASLRAGKR